MGISSLFPKHHRLITSFLGKQPLLPFTSHTKSKLPYLLLKASHIWPHSAGWFPSFSRLSSNPFPLASPLHVDPEFCQASPTWDWRARPLARLGGLPGSAWRCGEQPASPAAESSRVCGDSPVTAPGSSSAPRGAPGPARPGEGARGAGDPWVGSEGSVGPGRWAGSGSLPPALPCPDPGDSC